MEFLEVVGSRRSIRWFKTWQPVERAAVQRILEAARFTGCPGNLQPWRAVVLWQDEIPEAARESLLDAANRQRPHEQAPVWIYWFGDTTAVSPQVFLHQIELGLDIGALAEGAGWDRAAARASIYDGSSAPAHMPPLHETVNMLPPEMVPAIAAQETNGAITTATFAAVDAGLGTCLQIPAMPSEAPVLYETLGVPEHLVPVWLQLVGHPAEDRAGGGQRPRDEFDDLFSLGRFGEPFPRDTEVVADMERRKLLQPPAPLPGREEEIAHLSRMFGYADGERS